MAGVCRGLNCIVNRNVAGSSPARGANSFSDIQALEKYLLPTLVNSSPKQLVRSLRAKRAAAVALALPLLLTAIPIHAQSGPHNEEPTKIPLIARAAFTMSTSRSEALRALHTALVVALANVD